MSRPAAVLDARSPRRPALLRGRAPLRMLAGVTLISALVTAGSSHASWPILAALWAVAFALVIWTLRADGGVKLIGPLFIYDLARLARRGRTRLLRCVYAALLLAWLGTMVLERYPQLSYHVFDQAITLSISESAKLARNYVLAILSMQVAAVLVLTPAYLAGALAEEKERRTIELLFTTDLRDRELVLGKLVGRLLHLGTILLVALPILSLTRLWGGVDGDLLLAGFAVSILTMLSVGSMSLLCSVLSRTVLGAVVSSYAVVVLMNLWCQAVPILSPLLFVPEWDRRVDAEWKLWDEQRVGSIPISGPPLSGPAFATVVPPPNPTLILAEMLVPYTLVHGSIFLFCAITAIVVLRETCLVRGEVHLRGAPATGTVTSSWGPLVEPASERRRHPRPEAARSMPVREPALLWKEMYHGSEGFAGPPLREWLKPTWLPFLIVLASMLGGSLFFVWTVPEIWVPFLTGLNVLLRVCSVLGLGLWCLLLAFRVAGSISRERDQQTLEVLFTLPVDRQEILRAKWLGSILRFRQIGYLLAAVWAVGLALGVLHPWGAVLLVAACCVHLAFLASLGLWLSLASRNTLWANMSMALVLLLLFSGSWLAIAADPVRPHTPSNWPDSLLDVHLTPLHTWWSVAFSWRDLTEAILEQFPSDDSGTRESSELTRSRTTTATGYLFPQSALKEGPQFLRALTAALVGLLFFGTAAWVFWQLSCRRFRRESSG